MRRIDICCVAKREWLTIKDWVDYHINLGFHKIWIYQNDGDEGYIMKDILSNYVENGCVEILDDYAYSPKFQLEAYNKFNALHKDTDEYDWVGYIDCDEYFDYNHELYNSLDEYFSVVEERCPNIGVLRVNWEVYDDNGQYYYDDKPVIERFPKPAQNKIDFGSGDDENYHIKSFVKSGTAAIFPCFPHNCYTYEKLEYESDFSVADMKSPWYLSYSFEHSMLKHYVTKSLEEYLFRKFYLDHGADGVSGRYSLDYYWKRNKKTDEALKTLDDLLINEKYKNVFERWKKDLI